MNLYANDMAQPNAISENGNWAVGSAFWSGKSTNNFEISKHQQIKIYFFMIFLSLSLAQHPATKLKTATTGA